MDLKEISKNPRKIQDYENRTQKGIGYYIIKELNNYIDLQLLQYIQKLIIWLTMA